MPHPQRPALPNHDPNRTPAFSTADRTLLILTFAALGMAALLALLPAAGHDQMWLLYAANLTLHGAPLYGSQVFETNPPLILWLSTIPAALANLTHLPATALGKLFVAALELGVATLCLRLLRRIEPAISRTTLYALGFTFVVAFAVLPARDFGQRDHLLILFLLPYVVAAALRACPNKHPADNRQRATENRPSLPIPLATLIGILALLGLVLKPHQVLVVIAVEATLLILSLAGKRLRTLLRPEIMAMFLSGLAFLAAIRIFAPLYFTVVLPLVRDTYWAYGHLTPPQLLLESIQLHLLVLACWILAAALGWRTLPALTRILLIAGSASLVAFYLQGTGWYYQQLPALTLLCFALTLLLLECARRGSATIPRWTPAVASALSLLTLGLTAHFMNYPFTAERSFPVDTPDPAFFANLPPGTPVMTLSPTIDDTLQPIFKYHLTLGQRYPAFLLLPALLRANNPDANAKPIARHFTPQRLTELNRIQEDDMREDLERWHPQLLLVERCQDPQVHCQVLEDRHDNLLAFFQRDPAVAALLSRYHLQRSIGPYDGYTLTN